MTRNRLKRLLIFRAARTNDLNLLMENLDSTNFNAITDDTNEEQEGYNLLHLSVIYQSDEIFNYILSLGNFPLNAPTGDGETALFLSMVIIQNEKYTLQLLENGADINKTFSVNTILHTAIRNGFTEAAKFLIRSGIDLNSQNAYGFPPLHYCFDYTRIKADLFELVPMLLFFGADPSISSGVYSICEYIPFYMAMSWGNDLLPIQEMLFEYTFDSYRPCSIHMKTLLKAAEQKSPLFDRIVGHYQTTLLVDERLYKVDTRFDSVPLDWSLLFKIEPQYLKIVIEKFESGIRELLRINSYGDRMIGHPIFFENFVLLLESNLQGDTTNFLRHIDNNNFIKNLKLMSSEISETNMLEILCYLASYGLIIDNYDLETVFKKFGYGKLFTLLLQMDVEPMEKVPYRDYKADIVPVLIYNVTTSLEDYLSNLQEFSTESIRDLLDYFVHPQLKEFCCNDLGVENIAAKARNMPEVPLLKELSRNTFRKHFVESFNISTSSQFHYYLKRLPISFEFKKIITLEKKLYRY